MKTYILALEEAQKNIDLREYGETISNAVFSIIADDDLVVSTGEKSYTIEMDRPTTQKEESAIEEILRNSELGQFCTENGPLFISLEEVNPILYAY